MMKKCLLVAVGLAAWIGFGAVEVGGLPAWEFADTEVSTNVPFAFPQVNVKHFFLSMELAGTPSNNVQVAFGRDANTNGVLEVEEAGFAIGWDCGEWRVRGCLGSLEGLGGLEERPSEELNRRNSAFDNRLRPTDFDGFVGQEKIRDRLMLAVKAAKDRGESLDHVLFSGPPGLGKTTLSYILGEAMGVNVKTTSGPVITKPGDLAGLLTSLEPGDIVFIDEIHRLAKTVEEYLYSAMEDYAIDIVLDQGPNARSVRLDLPHFTLVGATTRIGLIAAPLRERFGLVNRLSYYEPKELAEIVKRSAAKLGVDIDEAGALEISRRARGTPRIANNLLKRVRDYAQVKAGNFITGEVAKESLELLEIDPHGLDEMDRKILETICVKFGGGPVGLSTIAVSVGEEPDTIEEAYEPFLIMEGYLERTPKGRVASALAYQTLGLNPPNI